jgi:hypothetical protein
MIARANYAAALMRGPSVGRPAAYDAAALPRQHGFGTGTKDLLTFHHRLLFGTDPAPAFRKRMDGASGRAIVERLLASPEAQLA